MVCKQQWIKRRQHLSSQQHSLTWANHSCANKRTAKRLSDKGNTHLYRTRKYCYCSMVLYCGMTEEHQAWKMIPLLGSNCALTLSNPNWVREAWRAYTKATTHA